MLHIDSNNDGGIITIHRSSPLRMSGVAVGPACSVVGTGVRDGIVGRQGRGRAHMTAGSSVTAVSHERGVSARTHRALRRHGSSVIAAMGTCTDGVWTYVRACVWTCAEAYVEMCACVCEKTRG